ncbi:MAG: hypothetical protein EAZ17_00165, partial [Sphingobacteriales bacterium]
MHDLKQQVFATVRKIIFHIDVAEEIEHLPDEGIFQEVDGTLDVKRNAAFHEEALELVSEFMFP